MKLNKWMYYICSIVFTVLFTLHCLWSFHIAEISKTRDFAAFYSAASIVIDPSLRDEGVYDPAVMEKAAIERGLDVKPDKYLYSLPIAYLFSPLTLLSYENAKLAFLIINLLSYFAANIIILKLMQPARKWLPFFAVIPWIWLPFLINQYWIQSNSILFLLIALGIYLSLKKKDLGAGFMFGLAILLKVFPIILVMLIGIKNWRIFIASMATCSLFLVFPGSLTWIEVLMHTNHPNFTPIALWLKNRGPFWMLTYQGIIFGLSALLVYRFKSRNYLLIAAFGVVSSLLISPVVGGYYYTLLMLCFAYLYYSKQTLPIWVKLAGVVPFLIFSLTLNNYSLNFFGLLLLWFLFAWSFTVQEKTNESTQRNSLILSR
jgi:hypothetical protein